MTDGQKEPEGGGGLTLDEALEAYASVELWRRFVGAKDVCPPQRGPDGGLSYSDDHEAYAAREAWYMAHPRRWAYEAVKREFGEVWSDLLGRLVSGELIGFGYESGYPSDFDSRRKNIAPGLWVGAIYQLSDVVIGEARYSSVLIWRRAGALAAGAGAGQPNNSSGKAAVDCEAWLCDLVARGAPAKVKAEYRDEAVRTFAGLSGRAFELAWRSATKGRDDWHRPGRKKK